MNCIKSHAVGHDHIELLTGVFQVIAQINSFLLTQSGTSSSVPLLRSQHVTPVYDFAHFLLPERLRDLLTVYKDSTELLDNWGDSSNVYLGVIQ